MKKLFVLALATGLYLTSCSNDDNFKNVEVKNPELKTILSQRGYSFNDVGQLIQDDKVLNTTNLDLSGTKLADLSGLDIFPNLSEVNLSNNEYGPVFDFSPITSNIKAINLTGNEIYDFEGLVDAKVENDDVKTTILRPLTKLYLPESAKWNVEDLMPFYVENKAKSVTVDMQIQDASGKLQAYTILRDIPDEHFRGYLKTLFASLFPNNGIQLDISKPMGLTEQGAAIVLWDASQYADIEKIESIEGVEYFINNPYYKSFNVSVGYKFENSKVSHLTPRNNIMGLYFAAISTSKGMDLSKATSLATLSMSNNEYLTELDLSNTLIYNQKIGDINSSIGNSLNITHCKNLKSIEFPEQAEGIAWTLTLGDLPALEKLDLKFVHAAQDISLLQLPKCNIIYPDLKKYYSGAEGALYDLTEKSVDFAITEDVFNMASTKEFITKYRTGLRDRYRTYQTEYGAIRWSKLM